MKAILGDQILGDQVDFNAVKEEIRKSFEKVFNLELKEQQPLVDYVM